ncbi:MAG: hypothetical protein U0Y82_16335 [Thermoleophilia bacterium]
MNVQATGQGPQQVWGAQATTGMSMPPPQMRGTMDGIASTLKMSSDDLRSALKQGKSLADVASSQGVSRDTLTTALGDLIQQQRTAQGKPALDAQSLDKMVTQAVDRQRPAGAQGGHGHHHHHGGGTVQPTGGASDPTGPVGTAVDAAA